MWSALWSQTAISKLFFTTSSRHDMLHLTLHLLVLSNPWDLALLLWKSNMNRTFFFEFPVPTSWSICDKTTSITVEYPKHHFPDLFLSGLIMSKRRRVRGEKEERGGRGRKGDVLLKVPVICGWPFLWPIRPHCGLPTKCLSESFFNSLFSLFSSSSFLTLFWKNIHKAQQGTKPQEMDWPAHN